MEQILDNYIAVAVVFLLLALIVKGMQDILKYFFDLKDKILASTMDAFMGPNLKLPHILDYTNTVFGRRDAKFLESLSAEQFRRLLDGMNQAGLSGLADSLGFTSLDDAKDFAAVQFKSAIKNFQEHYERYMAVWVFCTSLVVVLLFNANILYVYENIRDNAVTRQALISIAEAKYAQALRQKQQNTPDPEAVKKEIARYVADAPVMMRGIIGGKFDFVCGDSNIYCQDFREHPLLMIPGLLFSAFLVYLGAPFWHDLLESLLSAKNVLRKKE
jgi:hypothetical protein